MLHVDGTITHTYTSGEHARQSLRVERNNIIPFMFSVQVDSSASQHVEVKGKSQALDEATNNHINGMAMVDGTHEALENGTREERETPDVFSTRSQSSRCSEARAVKRQRTH